MDEGSFQEVCESSFASKRVSWLKGQSKAIKPGATEGKRQQTVKSAAQEHDHLSDM